MAYALGELGRLAAAHDPIRCARLAGAALRINETLGVSDAAGEQRLRELYAAHAPGDQDEKTWEAEWRVGHEMSLEAAVDYALAMYRNQ